MTWADIVLVAYGVLCGFACGCAVTAAIATWRVGLFSEMDHPTTGGKTGAPSCGAPDS